MGTLFLRPSSRPDAPVAEFARFVVAQLFDRRRFPRRLLCELLFPLERKHLAYKNRNEDEAESRNELERELFSVQSDRKQHAEHRLKTQEQRSLRGGDMRERYILEHEGNARSEYDEVGHIEQEGGIKQHLDGRKRFEACADRHTAHTAEQKLPNRQHEDIAPLGKLRHVHDVNGEHERAQKRHIVAEPHGKRPLQRDEAHARNAEHRRSDVVHGRSLSSYKPPNERHEHAIRCREKRVFPRRRIGEADRLDPKGEKDEQPQKASVHDMPSVEMGSHPFQQGGG